MSTNVGHPAKREYTALQAAAGADATIAIAKAAAGAAMPGTDAQDFVRSERIHIKDGSVFIDPYLVLHPRELDPKNEARLRQKLQLTYGVNNPSFYESKDRWSVALNLAQLIPTTLAAKHSRLLDEVKKYNTQVDSNTDAELTKTNYDKQHPFGAIMRDTLQHPARDPIGMEALKNGLAMYMLMREKMSSLGYLDPLTSYMSPSNTPDKVLGELEDKIGIAPIAVRQAALKGGIDGVGALLKLDPAYVAEVKQMVELAATHEFSHNLVEHWHLGRQRPDSASLSMQQKLAAGMNTRINAKINDYRARVHHFYDVPQPVKAEEKRIADALNLVEPIQRALMFKLGYEICYTPDYFADGIAKYPFIYGLHRKTANDMRDVQGTYRIYFSERGDRKASMRTLVHEIAHNLWPEYFTPEDVKKIDAYAASDVTHFKRWQTVVGEPEHFQKFERFFNAYKAGNDSEKVAVMAAANQWLAHHGVNVDGLFPYLHDARDFQYMVKYANDTLSTEGQRYTRSGYESPQERFREVISRFAELKQVEYRSDPQLLHFLAPGLDQVWEAHYIPHLKRVYQRVVAGEQRAAAPQIIADAAQTPKVAERPVAPAHADADAAPRTSVMDVLHNGLTSAASAALDTMGISPR